MHAPLPSLPVSPTGTQAPDGWLRGNPAANRRHPSNFALAVLLAAVALATGCHHEPAPPESGPALPTLEVSTQPVVKSTQSAAESVVGTVRPKLQVVIEAKLSGRIEELPVEVGQRVKQGDLIVALGVQEVQARLDQALTRQQQANRDLQRYRQLLDQGAVTQAEFDNVEAAQRIADAGVLEAQTMMSYAKVVAPVAGVVTRKHAERGDLATPGRPLVTLEDDSLFRLETDVPEALATRLDLGTELAVTIPALELVSKGRVAEIAPSADAGSRTFRVKLDLPTTEGLLSGQFGRAEIPLGGGTALQVPATAISRRGQLEMVFVITNDVARMRIVKTGRPRGDLVEVLAGLDANEVVAVTQADSLLDGQPVRVTSR
ncbi:MAG: efflux RND transporter periplasmic adaptor subunit [Verrucomicrobiales bacterium]|nr:efflux RND transporter periplasmic adaptor subunit [Verrucomicrobiales bacterium]